MTNEQYLIISYFSAAAFGVLAAFLTGLVLRGPLRPALSRFTAAARRFMGRAMFAWLVLGALFAFTLVGYFGDCDHHTYQSIVDDMPWMVQKNREQANFIFIFLLVGVLTYALTLAVVLVVRRPANSAGHEK